MTNVPEIGSDAAARILDQMMTIYVQPEIMKRISTGSLPQSFNLSAAQVVFPPDGRAPIVRLNAEVKVVSKMKLKNGVKKQKGEVVYKSEVEHFGHMILSDEADADCGHMTMIVHHGGGSASMTFDLIYNKSLSKAHLEKAGEFLASAQDNYASERWAPFTEDLFAACELIAKGILLGMPDPKFRVKNTHDGIQARFNLFSKSGYVKDDHKRALNRLASLRGPARYMKGGKQKLDKSEAEKLLETVREMKRYAEEQITR